MSDSRVDGLQKIFDLTDIEIPETISVKDLAEKLKKQASEVCKEEAERSGMFYMTERWLGGTLTNFKTIRRRVKRLDDIEKMENDGTFEKLPKKEVIGLKKEYDKLNKILCGIRNMDKLPQAMFIVDPSKEEIAIREARKLNIPVFGIVDTNCDPDMVDYVIPANDDAIRAVKLIIGVMNNAIIEANGGHITDYSGKADENGNDIMKRAVESVKRKEDKKPFDRKNFDKKPFDKKNFKKSFRNVIVLPKMTFPDEKVLTITINEEQISGRGLTLHIDYQDVLNADGYHHTLK